MKEKEKERVMKRERYRERKRNKKKGTGLMRWLLRSLAVHKEKDCSGRRTDEKNVQSSCKYLIFP